MFISSRLKECREAAGLSQEGLMFLLYDKGIKRSRQTICHWEKGTRVPPADDLSVLASLLGKPIEYFFDQPLTHSGTGR